MPNPVEKISNRLTEDALRRIMNGDIVGTDAAFDWVVDDIANNYFADNPESEYREKILAIVNNTDPVNEEDKKLVFGFVTNIVGLSDVDFRRRVIETYARQKGYEILNN
jgi:hypothetical protein